MPHDNNYQDTDHLAQTDMRTSGMKTNANMLFVHRNLFLNLIFEIIH